MIRPRKPFLICASRFALCTFIAILLSCSSGDNNTADFGTVIVQAVWSGETTKTGTPAAQIFKAAPAGVVTIRLIVSGPGMSDMQKDFAASADQCAISGVPAGSKKVVTLYGLNSSETVMHIGQANEISVNGGETSQTISITMIAGDSIAFLSPPTAPANVKMTAGDGNMAIRWDAVQATTSYNLYFATTSGVTKTNGSKITGVTSPYLYSSAVNGTTYYCVVTAVNGSGESAESVQVSAMPNGDATVNVIVRKVSDTGQTTRYSTVFGDDSDYLINPPSFTDTGNGTIKDNVTGLIWQRQSDGVTRSWDEANTYCSGLNLGGYSMGWRLPTRMELVSIVNYGNYNPAIDTAYFPNTQSSNYWSSTSWSSTTWSTPTSLVTNTYAQFVQFSLGFVAFAGKDFTYHVRCVHEGQ